MALAPFGFNVFAPASGNFGQAVAARNTITMLLENGVSVAVRDQRMYDGRSGHHREYDGLSPGPLRPMPWGVNLFHLNPDDILDRIPLQWIGLPIEKRMNVGVPFWELPKLPPRHVQGLEMMDLVLAPSRFIMDAVREALPDARVEHFPQAAYLPEGVVPDRERWGFADDEVVFLCGFDILGDIERKNPWAAIGAFTEAFGTSGGVRLVVKVANAGLDPAAQLAVARLLDLAQHRPDIMLVDDRLTYEDTLGLYASADVLVSLHRAEGLGLVLMEAMSLGKPVIATAWSGSMDFTGEEDSCLVGYDLVPVSATHPSYQPEYAGAGLKWAEPRRAEAVAWMRRLAGDAALRDSIGAAAAEAMRARREAHRDGHVVALLKEAFEAFDPSSPAHAAKAKLITERRRGGAASRLARAPRGLARALARRAGAQRRTRTS